MKTITYTITNAENQEAKNHVLAMALGMSLAMSVCLLIGQTTTEISQQYLFIFCFY